jgi:hypothetical protein
MAAGISISGNLAEVTISSDCYLPEGKGGLQFIKTKNGDPY